MSRIIGKTHEDVACTYLQEKGLKLLERNFSCKRGEIDLIMQEGSSIVFVEVRYRKNNLYGTGAETISALKQKKLIMAAQVFLSYKRWHNTYPCRFDVLSLSKDTQENRSSVQWIRDAFQLS